MRVCSAPTVVQKALLMFIVPPGQQPMGSVVVGDSLEEAHFALSSSSSSATLHSFALISCTTSFSDMVLREYPHLVRFSVMPRAARSKRCMAGGRQKPS